MNKTDRRSTSMYALILILFLTLNLLVHASANQITNRQKQQIPHIEFYPLSTSLFVDDDAEPSWYDPYHFRTIQEAINAALPNSVINVYSGMYHENVQVNKNDIQIIGEETTPRPIIDGGWKNIVVVISGDRVFFSDFIVQNSGSESYDAGIYVDKADHNTIENCTLRQNTVGLYSGCSCDNIFSNITMKNNDIGIWLDRMCYETTVMNCTMYNNSDKGLFLLEFCEECSIKNCTIYNNLDGIFSLGSTKCHFFNNTMYDNFYGLYVLCSDRCTLRGNSFSDNTCNLCIAGGHIFDFSHTITTDNTINGKPIYFLTGQQNITIDETSNAGYVGLVSCRNITVQNLDVYGISLSGTRDITITNVSSHHSKYGVQLSPAKHTHITHCSFFNTFAGVYATSDEFCLSDGLFPSEENDVTNSTIHDNSKGIWLASHSNFNLIKNNTITGNSLAGIQLDLSSYNTITKNIVSTNAKGISVDSQDLFDVHDGSCFNIVTDNTLINNVVGLEIKIVRYPQFYVTYFSNNSRIYHNNFIDNVQNAYDECSNTWDNGYPSGGNYWDDYTGIDADSDGIGDSVYNISGGNNQDRYPLMNPYNWNTPPTVPMLSGPSTVLIDHIAMYTCVSNDSNGDSVSYLFNWGDTTDDWLGPVVSGVPYEVGHSWAVRGDYEVSLQAKDSHDAVSGWSDPFVVHVVLLGDMNDDGFVNTADINAFVLALTDPDDYENTYGLDPCVVGDCNQDGSLNTADIDAFVSLLIG